LLPDPWITNPAIRMLPPVPTLARAERLMILPEGGGGVVPERVSVAAELVADSDPLVTVTV
jgi:hypothetical protein